MYDNFNFRRSSVSLGTPRTINLDNFRAVTANTQANHVSSKYAFIPTTRAIQAFEAKNWSPVKVQEVRAREDRQGFQKHLIRFRYKNSAPVLNDLHPEIVLINSHDGASSFQIMAGLFRLVCSNGLIIADEMFGCIRIKHMGYTDKAVHTAIEHVADSVPRITGRVKDFQTIDLTPDERGIFAAAALHIKYGEEAENRAFDTEALLHARRYEDRGNDLWKTYNILQEKLIETGGRFERKADTWGRQKMTRARRVNNIGEDVRINKGLWLLTEKMAELKGAGAAAI